MSLSMRSLLLALPLAALAGCAGEPVKTEPQAPASLPPEFVATHMAVLRCPDLAPVALQLNDHAVRIDGVGGPRDLPEVASASGAKYEAEGFLLWFKEDGALYQQPEETEARDCRVYPVKGPWESAALREVSFRAIGTEPGWVMEVVPDKWILLLMNYGQDRVVLPPVAAEKDGDTLRFRVQTDKNKFDAVVTPLPCSDGMSDDRYEQMVSITLNGIAFRGCGRFL